MSQAVKKQQWALLVGLMACIGLILAAVHYGSGGGQAPTGPEHSEKLDGPVNQTDLDQVWVEQTQDQLQQAHQREHRLAQQIQRMQQAQKQQREQHTAQTDQVKQLQHQLQALQRQLKNQASPDKSKPKASAGETKSVAQSPNDPTASNPRPFPEPGQAGGQPAAQPTAQPSSPAYDAPDTPAGIQVTTLKLKPRPQSHQPVNRLNHYIPSGTYARAVVIGGADTSAGVNNQADPTPVLLRLVGPGRAPNGRRLTLKGCRITAAAIGNVSAERGQIRLERLSCARSNGRVIDVAVKGTVFGPSGHNGVRGRQVSRNRPLLYNAGMSGLVSGIGGGLSKTFSTISQSPLGSTQTVQGSDVFKNGLAQGAQSAMGKLSDYYIKQAEQYHPIIELNAGTPVDVVFLKGVKLDEDDETHQAGAGRPTAASDPDEAATASQAAERALAQMPQQREDD
jgi:conjugal transfer pilus assembly protein TraB